MRLHTALHIYHSIIMDVMQGKLDNPLLSTIEDGYAINKYDENSFSIDILPKVTEKFYKLIKNGATIKTYPDNEKDNYLYWQCMNYIIPCGEIHVDNLNEIGNVEVETIHRRKAITIKITIK